MVQNPDPDGRYRDRPAKTLAEWKEVRKACSTNYELGTLLRPKQKVKRRSKFRQSEILRSGHVWHAEKETQSIVCSDDNGETLTNQTRAQGVLQDDKVGIHKKSKKNKKTHIQFFVKTPLLTTERFYLKRTTTVQKLKELLKDKFGLATDVQIMQTGKLRMCDQLTLEDHGITDDSNIELQIVRGLLGGADRDHENETSTKGANDATNEQLLINNAKDNPSDLMDDTDGHIETISDQGSCNSDSIVRAIKDLEQQQLFQQASYDDVAKFLKVNCRRLGLQFHGQTPGDGNCFYHAVSDQLDLLNLQSKSAAVLRKTVVQFLRTNSTIQGTDGIIDFTKVYPDWNEYCDRMSQDGEWADHVIIVATANLLRRDIMIVSSSPHNQGDQAVYWIRCGSSFSGEPIRLGHLRELHYQSLQTADIQKNTSSPQDFKEAMKMKEEGNNKFKEGHYNEAIYLYKRAELFLGNFEPLNEDDAKRYQDEMVKIKLNITMCALKLEAPNAIKALKYSAEVLKLDPINSKALYRRGLAFIELNKLTLAHDSLVKAVTVTPTSKLARDKLDMVKRKMQALQDESITDALKAVNDIKQKGNALFKQGDIRMAIKTYQSAEEMLNNIKPARSDHTRQVEDVQLKIYLNISQCLLHEKDNKSALSYSEKALHLDSSNFKALARHGRASFRLNHLDIAEKSFTKALEICPMSDQRVITEELTEVQRRKALRQKASDLSVDVEYIPKKKDKPIPGAEEAICGIIACLNEGLGGKVTLVNKTKKKGTECEDFDKELHNYFAEKVGQTDNYTIEGSYKDKRREVLVLPVDQDFLVYKSHAYKRSETSSFEVTRTKELIGIMDSTKRDLPIIPSTFQYNKEIMTEGRMIEFKEVTAKNLIKNFDSRYGHKYISSFANTSGGRVLYGIKDNGVVKGVEGIAFIEDFHHEIAQKVNATYWFQQDKGQIKPVEGKDWKLEFKKVEGAPDEKELYVIVLSVPRFEGGIVFCKQPLCPVLDTKQKHGYRMLRFDEWCQYLKRFPECRDDFVERMASDLRTQYQNTICKKQLFPWEPGCFVELDDIYVQLTIDIEIPKPCKPIKQRLSSYTDIFKPEEQSMRYVLEGRPGLGKTTLCAKIAHDWSRVTEKSPLDHIKLLFVLQLGQIHYDTNIEDAIKSQLLPSLEIGGTQKLRKALQSLGPSVVIILDSLDEADPVLFEHADYGNLIGSIKYSEFKTNRILVTTRPWRVLDIAKIPSCPYKRLELQGFHRADIVKFVRKFFGHNPTDVTSLALGERLVQYIQANKLLVDASVPILILQLCWYWQKIGGKEDIPQRWGQLYDNIFNIMYSSLAPEKQSLTKKEHLVQQLGRVAYKGLTPTSTKLVFLENVVELPEDTKTAAIEMGLISRKGNQQKSLTFYHKSIQEKVAGDFLAHNPRELSSYLESVRSVKEAQQVGQVLIATSASSKQAALRVVKKLMSIFKHDLRSELRQCIGFEPDLVTTLNINFHEYRTLQEYIELCLACNFEADAKAECNRLLCNLFPGGVASFCGIRSYLAVVFGYFLKYCGTSDITGVTLQPIMELSDPMAAPLPLTKLFETTSKTMLCIDDARINEICRDILEKHRDSYRHPMMQWSPREWLASVQCAQACEGLGHSYETNIEHIISGLKHVNLLKLFMPHFKLEGNFTYILESIENGYMRSLTNLSVPSINVSAPEMTRLVSLLPNIPNLMTLDISFNKNIETGKTVPALAKYFNTSKLQRLHVQRMLATSSDMEILAQSLKFAPHEFAHLAMDGNYMSDKVGSNLKQFLPKQLIFFSTSVAIAKQRELVLSLTQLKKLKQLRLFHGLFSSELVQDVASVLQSCTNIEVIWIEGNRTSPCITHNAWTQMGEAMKKHKKLRELNLRYIDLGKGDFEELVRIGKAQCYRKLRYSSECLPRGAAVPQEDFFLLM